MRAGERRRRNAPAAVVHPEGNILLIFLALMLAMLVAALNQTVLATALPTVVGDLDGANLMLWVITTYILASTVTMPIYGKLGDLMGRRSLLISAIAIFLIGSCCGALSPDIHWLIAARLVQGIGGGGLMILSQAIIADVVPARERGRYMGWMSGVFAFSSVVGPLIGGWLTEGPGWRWVFWFNVPVGLAALAGAVFFIRPPTIRARPRLDLGGITLITVFTTAMVLVSSWGGTVYPWVSPAILGLGAVVVASGVALPWVERRAAEPILPMHLFRERNFNLTTAASLLSSLALFAAIGYMPTYLQMSRGVSATAAGLLTIPLMGAMLATSVLSGSLIARTGRYKWMPIFGSVMLSVALVLLGTSNTDTPLWLLCTWLGVLGFGMGFNMQVLVLIVQNSFPGSQVGTATAANNFFRQIGATLGSALTGSLFAERLLDQLGRRLPAEHLAAMHGGDALTPAMVHALPPGVQEIVVTAYNQAFMPLFLFMIPMGVAAAILCLFVVEVPMATTLDQQPATTTPVEADLPVGTESSAETEPSPPAIDGDALDGNDLEQDGLDETAGTPATR